MCNSFVRNCLSQKDDQLGLCFPLGSIKNQESINHPNQNLDQTVAYTGVDILVFDFIRYTLESFNFLCVNRKYFPNLAASVQLGQFECTAVLLSLPLCPFL